MGMLTADQVRKELEMVPEAEINQSSTSYRRSPEWVRARLKKVCHNHPDRTSLIAESGRILGQCEECLVASRKLGAANRAAKKAGKTPKPIKTRLVPIVKITDLRPAHFVGTAGELPAPPPLPLALKIFCMRCGFPMAIEEPSRFFNKE